MDLSKYNITDEMRQHYLQRTDKHVQCVRKNMYHLMDEYPNMQTQLLKNAAAHDLTKYVEPEIIPYVFITWDYKCKDDDVDFEIPEDIDDQEATWHHVKHNSHHPEYWDDSCTKASINSEDRDKPAEMVDGTEMPDIDLAELACDWHAMGLEKGNTAKSWADKNINVRWKFNKDQVDKIYEFLKGLNGQKDF